MTSTERVEKLFSRLGLAAASVSLLLLVLLLDLCLSGNTRPAADADPSTFDVVRFTRDGRFVGGDPLAEGVQLVLAPLAVYENRPHQPAFGINSRGCRGPEFQAQATRPRLIVVGGSAAFGDRLPEEQSFTALLRERNPGVEVINAAVIGYLSSQELGLAVSRLIDLEPDLIVAFNGWNNLYDPYWAAIAENRNELPDGTPVEFRSIEDRLARQYEIHESPWVALSESAGTITRKSTLLSAASLVLRRAAESRPVPEFGPEWRQSADAAYVRDMLKLRDLARSVGSRFVVLLQPELSQLMDAAQLQRVRDRMGDDFVEGDSYWRLFPGLYREFRANVAGSLAAAGVNVIDVSPLLQQAFRSGDSLFLDPVHLSPRGHEQVAQILAAEVETLAH